MGDVSVWTFSVLRLDEVLAMDDVLVWTFSVLREVLQLDRAAGWHWAVESPILALRSGW
jgi:hypothetical protein